MGVGGTTGTDEGTGKVQQCGTAQCSELWDPTELSSGTALEGKIAVF